jgi:hypothetical protein
MNTLLTPIMSAAWNDAQRRGDGYPTDINPWDVAHHVMCAGQELERRLVEVTERANMLETQITKTLGAVTISRNGYVQDLEAKLSELEERYQVLYERTGDDIYEARKQRDIALERIQVLKEDLLCALNWIGDDFNDFAGRDLVVDPLMAKYFPKNKEYRVIE